LPEIVLDSPFPLSLGKPWPPRIAGGQVVSLLVLSVPSLERVLRRITQLPDGQADTLIQPDEEPHGTKPILV
jgi:hypothetical protein